MMSGQPLLDATCPRCGSGGTQRLQVVHEGGLHVQNSASTSLGGFAGGAAGGAAFVTSSRGTQQSILSVRGNPPKKQSAGCGAVLLIGGGLIAFVNPIALVAALIGIVLMLSVNRYNTRTWPPLYDEWTRTFMCGRCGVTFLPTGSNLSAVDPQLGAQRIPALQEGTIAIEPRRFCPQCGAKIESQDHAFCARCGASQAPGLPAHTEEQP